jgi:hypothetical protein
MDVGYEDIDQVPQSSAPEAPGFLLDGHLAASWSFSALRRLAGDVPSGRFQRLRILDGLLWRRRPSPEVPGHQGSGRAITRIPCAEP